MYGDEGLEWWSDRLKREDDCVGFIVKTDYGVGFTYFNDDLFFGKVKVYLPGGRKFLIDPENLIIKGI